MLPPSNLEDSLRQGIRGKNNKDSNRDQNTPEDNKPYVSHAHQNHEISIADILKLARVAKRMGSMFY